MGLVVVCRIGNTRLPTCRISVAVEDGHHIDPLVGKHINYVRKSPHECLTHILVRAGMQLRCFLDALEHGLNTFHEFTAQPRALVFIPLIGGGKVRLRFLLEHQWKRHDSPRILRLTSGHGEPGEAEDSRRAKRRSNSAFWASVSEKSP